MKSVTFCFSYRVDNKSFKLCKCYHFYFATSKIFTTFVTDAMIKK
jgi:hypothetical protein